MLLKEQLPKSMKLRRAPALVAHWDRVFEESVDNMANSEVAFVNSAFDFYQALKTSDHAGRCAMLAALREEVLDHFIDCAGIGLGAILDGAARKYSGGLD